MKESRIQNEEETGTEKEEFFSFLLRSWCVVPPSFHPFLHPFASALAAILRRRTRPADRNGESFPSNEPRLRPAGAGVG